jgi:hypothetical protein
MNPRIFKGKSCVVRERTKLSDRGSYAGVIVGYDEYGENVYVMNEDGIHTTLAHCVITDPIEIGKYYDEIKEEMLRLKKVMNDVLRGMHSSDSTMIKYCYNWTDYIIPTNIKIRIIVPITIRNVVITIAPVMPMNSFALLSGFLKN